MALETIRGTRPGRSVIQHVTTRRRPRASSRSFAAESQAARAHKMRVATHQLMISPRSSERSAVRRSLHTCSASGVSAQIRDCTVKERSLVQHFGHRLYLVSLLLVSELRVPTSAMRSIAVVADLQDISDCSVEMAVPGLVPGITYLRVTYLACGDFRSRKVHADCRSIAISLLDSFAGIGTIRFAESVTTKSLRRSMRKICTIGLAKRNAATIANK